MTGGGGFQRRGGFQRGGGAVEESSDYNPLLYRGQTPVLGAPVEIRSGGELPGEFPVSAPGPAPVAPEGGAPPSAPTFQFPGFEGEFGLEFGPMPERPGLPQIPGLPSGGAPWWAALQKGGETAGDAWQKFRDLQGLAPRNWVLNPADFSVLGGENLPWWEGSGQNFSLFGDEAAPVLSPDEFSVMGGDTGGPSAASFGDLVGPGLQAAGGLYGVATQDPQTPGFGASALNAAGGVAALGANLGLLPAQLAAAGPAAALTALPLIAGQVYEAFFAPDKARWPEGWQFIPGSSKSGGAGSAAVDPATGAILVYKGNGQYDWHEQTERGERVTPEQLRQWRIAPIGELARTPGYEQIGTGIIQDVMSGGDLSVGNLLPLRGATQDPGAAAFQTSDRRSAVGRAASWIWSEAMSQGLDVQQARQRVFDYLGHEGWAALGDTLDWKSMGFEPTPYPTAESVAAATPPPAPKPESRPPASTEEAIRRRAAQRDPNEALVRAIARRYGRRLSNAEIQREIAEAVRRGESREDWIRRILAHYGDL